VIEMVEQEPLERIWADPNLLRQVVENLVTNALQAMSSGGTLTVSLSPKSSEGAPGVELQIQDTGEGMDTTVRNRALDPFFTTRPSGTGLGLAIVARFVDAHGGFLQIRSAAGAGTVLHVFLPVASEGAGSARRSRPPASGRRAGELTPMPQERAKSAAGSGR
jgi:signal transduction histidine kinase